MTYAFKVGDRVIVAPEAFSRAGESGVITLINGDNAVVKFDDGDQMAYLLDDNELLIQETMPGLVTVATKTVHA